MSREDNRFDILRLLAAWMVLFSHCYPLTGRPQDEPLLGGIGVAIFFVLSGYLVAISLERSPSVLEFAKRRALRIYPALAVISLLCVLLLGPLMTTLPLADYWKSGLTWSYLRNASALSIQFHLPGVFAGGQALNAINGSLWSLPYEIICYIALALLSLLPGVWRLKMALALALVAGVLILRPVSLSALPFNRFMGLDYFNATLGLLFALGAVFGSWRDHIRPMLWPALGVLGAALMLAHGQLQLVLFMLGLGTLTLWLALYGRWLPRIPARVGDWSYGAYLYGFPVQQVMAYYKLHEVSFAGYVAVCTVVTFALAGLSWHFVEKEALRWK